MPLPDGVSHLDMAIYLAPKVGENVHNAKQQMKHPNPEWRKVWLAVIMQDLQDLGSALDGRDEERAAQAITQVAASAIAFVSELDMRTGRGA